MLPDGCLIYLGRKDFDVKIGATKWPLPKSRSRWRNILKLVTLPLMAWDREDREQYLAAYVVPTGQSETDNYGTTKLSSQDNLADYMIPSIFMFLDSLPLANGKLDRKALPKPDDNRPNLSQQYVRARNEIEQSLVQIWEDVLGIRPVGIQDSFFDLGGHSLGATRVISRVIKHFQVDLSLKSLFESPTVAAMASLITEHRAKKLSERELRKILEDLESMSDEQARKFLSELGETKDEFRDE